MTTLCSPRCSELCISDVDAWLPPLSTSSSFDDALWSSVDAVQPQFSTFHACAALTLSSWTSDAVEPPQHVFQTSTTSPPSGGGGETSWSECEELVTNDELDHCLSHLMMMSQSGCHGDGNNMSADWHCTASPLQAGQLQQPSHSDVECLYHRPASTTYHASTDCGEGAFLHWLHKRFIAHAVL